MHTLSLLPLVILASNATVVSANPLLPQGNFRTECLQIGKGGRHGLIAEVTIEGNTISASAQTYAHDNCDIPTVRADYRGIITEARTNGDRIELTQETGPFLYTLLSDEVTTYYNANAGSAGCGFDDWQTGVPRDAAGRTCAPYTFPAIGTELKDSVWANQTGIEFGRMPLVWDSAPDAGYPEKPSGILFTRVTD
ncbi:hypothetical protein [Martelella soudanensis]|uniref:hypothetical protein n=1 Tax=unclassified Martelella TaxID=2629616 RepID=UPI0015DF356A|nr:MULTISPECIES: hypothetical protein [unclassified Martelella]